MFKRTQLPAKPVIVLRQQRAFGQRVVHVGIKPGGHGHEVGPEMFQVVERVRERGPPGCARRARRDGIIETVAPAILRAGIRISRMLVHGKKLDAGPVQQNVLRAVAVMHVEIKNRDAPGTGRSGFERGDGDVVQVAKTHGLSRVA